MHSQNFNTQLIKSNISINISKFGMSEQYISFRYLHEILFDMIINNDDSIAKYRTTIKAITKSQNITQRTISYGLNKLLDKCNNPEIISNPLFNLNHRSTYNKIRVLKHYLHTKLIQSLPHCLTL